MDVIPNRIREGAQKMNHQTCHEKKRQCEICSQWYCPECYGRVCDTCHERRCNNCSAVEGNTVVCKCCSALECCVCGDVQFTPESEFAVTDGYGIWPCQAQACGVPVCNQCKFRDSEGLWLCRVCYRARGNSLADIMKREWVEFHHDSDDDDELDTSDEEEMEEEEDCHVCDRLPRLETQQDDLVTCPACGRLCCEFHLNEGICCDCWHDEQSAKQIRRCQNRLYDDDYEDEDDEEDDRDLYADWE